jgi:hypothetical protein
MKKLRTALGVLGLVAAALVGPAGAAGAADIRPAASHVPSASTSPPAGYTSVETGPFSAPAGAQTVGSATCPGSRQPIGGGAYPYDNNTSIDINSSYPAGQSWVVWVNNNETSDSKFLVWVMCMKANLAYTVVTASGYANPGATDSASVSCPAKTVVVGGGAVAAGNDLGVGINSSIANKLGPGQTEWAAAMSNTSSSGDAFDVVAICRPKPLGYAIVDGPEVSVAPGSTAEVSATCPGFFSLPLSGGGFTTYQTTDSGLAINATFPGAGYWATLWENGGSTTRSVAATVICAGT